MSALTNNDTGEPPLALFSSARWQKIRAQFELIVELAPESREVELVRIAAEDAELAADLRALLGSAPAQLLQAEVNTDQFIAASDAEPILTRVGPFRLLAAIGAGGMARVYLAEREHSDFVQRVALKLLDTASIRMAQFAARERRILAALTHPNITAFVDAGTQDGRAWIAMEYVQGEALLAHCNQQALTVRERVRLFDQICAAVAHAHAHLVVHRDLKPSNVLVDADGRAKLLDFGIAVILDDESTGTATRVFTPAYAAPEQLRGERVTTASDVYSLGLMLYELIVGKRLSTLERSAHEREWTPAELARAATTGDVANPATTPRDAKVLAQLLRGDLGRIIALALNPLPLQRYASVATLRVDLARWLEDRPLTIGRPDLLYVVRRFVQRHRIAVAAASFGLLAIFSLAATALWQARGKAQEAAVARAAQRQAEATSDFMNSVFLSADPYQGKGAQTTAVDLLAAARKRVDQELVNEPEVAAALLNQIGNVYVSLRNGEAAKETLTKALDYNARSVKPSIVLEGSIKARLAYQAYLPSQADVTARALADAVALLRSAGPEASGDLANALRMQANVLFDLPNEPVEKSVNLSTDDAVAVAREAMQIFEKLDASRAAEYLLSVQGLADMLVSLERFDEALAIIARGEAQHLAQYPDNTTMRGQLEGVRARALTGLKRFPEAERSMTAVIKASTTAFGLERSDTRYWRYRRVELLEEMGRLEAAQTEVQALIAIKAIGEEHVLAHSAHLITAARLSDARRDANAAAAAALAQSSACGEQGNAMFCAKAKLLSAEIAIRENRLEFARAALAEIANADATAQAEPILRRLNLLRARLARANHQFDAAKELLTALRSNRELSMDDSNLLDIEQGQLALATGDYVAAITLLTRARTDIAKTLTQPTPQLREIDAALARAQTARRSLR